MLSGNVRAPLNNRKIFESLSDYLKIDKGTTARAIQKLVDEGYVFRQRDEKDRRSYRVFLTEKGKKLEPLYYCMFRNGRGLSFNTSIARFFTSDLQSLLILRFIQGIGVAGMTSLPMLVIADVYKDHKSLYAMNKISMALAIGSVSAPLIGGGLANLGWNYPFLFYVLSLPLAFVAMAFLPETRVQRDNKNHKGILNGLTALKELRILYTVFLSFAIFFILFSVLTNCRSFSFNIAIRSRFWACSNRN
ncbi:MFS transporter [Methanosarcina mazei]|nr:MFS transporter [Methanosarcina mazei]